MENLKNQLGHHVVLEKAENGEIIDVKDVYVLTANEYRDARNAMEMHQKKLEQEYEDMKIVQGIEKARIADELAKQKEEEQAKLEKEKYDELYSKWHLLELWLTLKIRSFEGQTTLSTEDLDRIYGYIVNDELTGKEIVEGCRELRELFNVIRNS